ncbi:HD family phosphohydrolase [Kiritimatiella glycovorans]|uniref:Phosphodiesterase n=1 Tax=Kiritimatiella glycovorans TaxID=1307763 RepID=A0A0G3EJ49_9BACT|nr:HDIG domain-containing metalloprotein [Kiritimatiella glycovorans]AKJ64214.1 phosphodiesterase [Kiritimatiella glycovorans]
MTRNRPPQKKKPQERIAARKHAPRTRQGVSRFTVLNTLQLLLLWAVTILLFFVFHQKPMKYAALAPGQRAPETVVATVDFQHRDLAETRLRRTQAGEAVPPVFQISMAPFEDASQSLKKIFNRVERLRAAPDEESDELRRSLTDTLDVLGLDLRAEDFAPLFKENRIEATHERLTESMRAAYASGLISPEDRETRFRGLAPEAVIHLYREDDRVQASAAIDQLATPAEAVHEIARQLSRQRDIPDLGDAVYRRLLAKWLVPNLEYNQARTGTLREEARQRVKPVSREVVAGTTLVKSGSRLNEQDLIKLRAYQERLRELEDPFARLLGALGHGLILLLALAACTGLYRLLKHRRRFEYREVTLLALLALISLLLFKLLLFAASTPGVIPPALLDTMLPYGLAPLLGTILLGGGAGFVVGLWTSLAVATLFGEQYSMFLLGLFVAAGASFVARDVKRRSSLLRAGVFIGSIHVIFVLIMAVLNRPPPEIIALQAAAGFASGLFSAAAAVILIPMFESMFDITTDIRLLELSDMGHPLLQRLALEAPGTYHHSLMMANLASAAAERIGANPLLARVCAYYHDIGKLVKPNYFSENIQQEDNPHDEIAPSMSTLVIMSHVKEGVDLARKYRLPRPIIEGIREHHGTGLISYFYHQAKEEEKGGHSRIDDKDYRYPGPRPVSPEMAILHLADSVEAASRSLEKVTPSRIENMVDEIVSSKMKDRQLENCELTLAQLSEIKSSFTFTLTNMLHGRVAYPRNESGNSESAAQVQGPKPQDQGADRPSR